MKAAKSSMEETEGSGFGDHLIMLKLISQEQA